MEMSRPSHPSNGDLPPWLAQAVEQAEHALHGNAPDPQPMDRAARRAESRRLRAVLNGTAINIASCIELGIVSAEAIARLKDAIETYESGGQDADYPEREEDEKGI